MRQVLNKKIAALFVVTLGLSATFVAWRQVQSQRAAVIEAAQIEAAPAPALDVTREETATKPDHPAVPPAVPERVQAKPEVTTQVAVAPVASPPEPTSSFRDARLLTKNQDGTAPVAAAPSEQGAPVTLPKPAVPKSTGLFDLRDLSLAERKPEAPSANRETGTVVATAPARAGTAAVLQDQRGLLEGSQPTRSASEVPARPARAAESPATVAAASVPGTFAPAAAAPIFTDVRDLMGANSAPALPAQAEQPARTSQSPAGPERAERSPRPAEIAAAAEQPAARFERQPQAQAVAAAPGFAPAASASAPARPAVSTPRRNDPQRTSCEPAAIGSEPLDGGRMLIRLTSACRADQTVRFAYGDVTLARRLDGEGRLEWTLDLFAGTSSPLEIVFEDGTSREVSVRGHDLDKIEKFALIWRAPVDLDLHAFEYGATVGQAGHVWAQATSTAIAAREFTQTSKRGRGFLSRIDQGQGDGHKIEVYTFFHHPEERTGSVALAVDYSSRGEVPAGETCGSGALASVKFQLVSLTRGRVARETGVLSPVSCGVPIAPEGRFGAVHQIRIGR